MVDFTSTSFEIYQIINFKYKKQTWNKDLRNVKSGVN